MTDSKPTTQIDIKKDEFTESEKAIIDREFKMKELEKKIQLKKREYNDLCT